MRLASHLTSTTDTVERVITSKAVQGVGKLKAFELDVHIRVQQFQRKVAMLSVAILVAILGVGVWALSAYKAFSEHMSPAQAAFVTGLALFVVCGLLLYASLHPKKLKYKIDKSKT
ncbi:MAG: hypothetical protein H7249_08840 [Chitinophagaceae bacterium]|nr:hypothetical protein [Oligoflexus sp.]